MFITLTDFPFSSKWFNTYRFLKALGGLSTLKTIHMKSCRKIRGGVGIGRRRGVEILKSIQIIGSTGSNGRKCEGLTLYHGYVIKVYSLGTIQSAQNSYLFSQKTTKEFWVWNEYSLEVNLAFNYHVLFKGEKSLIIELPYHLRTFAALTEILDISQYWLGGSQLTIRWMPQG